MGAVIVDIADALVEVLNAHEFSQEFTAVRSYAPRYTPKELETLRVTVVANSLAKARASRGEHQEDYVIQVGVEQRKWETADLDALMALVEEIGDFCLDTELTVGEMEAKPMALENAPIYDPDLPDEARVFMSVVAISYRLWR